MLFCDHHDPEGPAVLKRQIRTLEKEVTTLTAQRDRLRKNNKDLREAIKTKDERWRRKLKEVLQLELDMTAEVKRQLQPGDLT